MAIALFTESLHLYDDFLDGHDILLMSVVKLVAAGQAREPLAVVLAELGQADELEGQLPVVLLGTGHPGKAGHPTIVIMQL